MNCKCNKTENQALIDSTAKNVLTKEELDRRIKIINDSLNASTWKELETHGKFDKNDKISFISDDMLIVGCDIGSETHYVRAIDTRGRELSSDPFSFSNSKEGFESAKRWMLELAVENDKNQIVLGLEPTGHYWFCLASWIISNGISVVQVNPYAVKQTKEIENTLHQKCCEIPHVDNVLEIEGLGLVACSSGKHKGETKISHRGRKRLRYWLFQGAKSVVVHSTAFKSLDMHYTTRAENPLKNIQSLIAIACKLLRVIYTLLLTGRKYDPERMLRDIIYPEPSQAKAA